MKASRAVGIVLFILLISISAVHAVGVAPAHTNIDFKAGESVTRSFSAVNTKDGDMDILVYAQGELAKSITFERNTYHLSPKGEAEVRFTVTMPSNLTDPGSHQAKIYVVEVPKERQVVVIGDEVQIIGGAQVTATVGVAHQVAVSVPYPGKYVQGKLYVNNADPGQPLIFTVGVINLGKEDISNVSARIKVFGATYEELGEVRTDSISLAQGKEGKIVAGYSGDLHPGTYKATAYIDYGRRVITIDKTFNVGSKLVKIKDLTVGDFRLGAIGKLDVLVENNWNEDMKGVVGEFDVSKDGKQVSTMKSPPTDVPALGESTVTGYWDTAGLGIGDYDINVKVAYGDTSSERLFPTYVGADKITVRDTLTARATGGQSGGSSTSLLVWAVLVLIVLNIVGIFIFLRMRKKPPSYNVSKQQPQDNTYNVRGDGQ
ncbi:MAG: hypothetical protein ABIA93_04825 [Candidatus Woesearchaeota archaeon]